MTKAEQFGAKVHSALWKLPEALIPLIIGYVLRRYRRYGLAELVEKGWNWKPEEGKRTDEYKNQ